MLFRAEKTLVRPSAEVVKAGLDGADGFNGDGGVGLLDVTVGLKVTVRCGLGGTGLLWELIKGVVSDAADAIAATV